MEYVNSITNITFLASALTAYEVELVPPERTALQTILHHTRVIRL